jgi:hypothetical protein
MNLWKYGPSLAANTIFNSIPVISSVQEARREHKSVMWAATKSAVRNNWQFIITLGMRHQMLGMFALGLVESAPPLIGLAGQFVKNRNDELRLSHAPFSQRFEHSDMTYKHQLRGLQSIQGTRSMIGGEAAQFAGRYSRR